MKPSDARVLWFTGLSGAGKSTLAGLVYQELKARNLPVERLDGDEIRNLFPQTGFSREDRDLHVKRVGYLSSLLQRNGVWVVVSLISPYREARDFVREHCARFTEIYVSTELAECERRDVKGLYAKARRGEIAQFTGVSDPYEPPVRPELDIDTGKLSVAEAARKILEYLERE